MIVVEVLKTVKETPDIVTLYFTSIEPAYPGQYIMVWLPGVDEVPMSLSTIGDTYSISIRVVGDATRALAALKIGDRIGVRGPYGNSYRITGRKPLLIGGGVGIASLTPLAEEMVKIGIKPTFLMGVRSGSQLLFKERIKRLGCDLLVSTDDGSEGYRGYASVYAADLLEKNRFDQLYVCGPELMMAKVFTMAEKHGIPIQASLERFLKCAIGLCGSCAIGPYRVCKDGPIFDTEMLRIVVSEFGKTRMDQSGRMIRVDH
jgi:dihydroorotate dehydrogenase electron transfer subunit